MRRLAAAYRDFQRLLFPLRAIIISVFLIVRAISVVAGFVPQRLWDREISGMALALVEDAIRALLLTPIVIAIHRFVILGEVTTGYGLDVRAPAFRLFFIWLFVLKVLAGLPYELLGVLQTRDNPLWGTTTALLVRLIVVIAVALRLTVLFPAIAVQTPGATAAHAFADTKGQALRLFAVFVLALLPWFAAVAVFVVVLGRGVSVAGSAPAMVALLVGASAQTAVIALIAAIASHAFMFLATHVKRAAS